jgi:hypothetical protein
MDHLSMVSARAFADAPLKALKNHWQPRAVELLAPLREALAEGRAAPQLQAGGRGGGARQVCGLRRGASHSRRQSGRQDLNLRPPGPQPEGSRRTRRDSLL